MFILFYIGTEGTFFCGEGRSDVATYEHIGDGEYLNKHIFDDVNSIN